MLTEERIELSSHIHVTLVPNAEDLLKSTSASKLYIPQINFQAFLSQRA